jgi:hypothetical protein
MLFSIFLKIGSKQNHINSQTHYPRIFFWGVLLHNPWLINGSRAKTGLG